MYSDFVILACIYILVLTSSFVQYIDFLDFY